MLLVLLPLSSFRIHLLSSLPRPRSTTPRSSPRLSSVILSPFLVPPFSPLSFPPSPSLSFSLSDPSFPLPPLHFIENVWYAGAFYTGTEPPPPLSGLMVGKEQPGRLLVRTFVSRTRGHAEMWPSTCSQGFETRAHARTRPTIEKEANEMFPWGLSPRLAHFLFVHYIRDIESFINLYTFITYVCLL